MSQQNERHIWCLDCLLNAQPTDDIPMPCMAVAVNEDPGCLRCQVNKRERMSCPPELESLAIQLQEAAHLAQSLRSDLSDRARSLALQIETEHDKLRGANAQAPNPEPEQAGAGTIKPETFNQMLHATRMLCEVYAYAHHLPAPAWPGENQPLYHLYRTVSSELQSEPVSHDTCSDGETLEAQDEDLCEAEEGKAEDTGDNNLTKTSRSRKKHRSRPYVVRHSQVASSDQSVARENLESATADSSTKLQRKDPRKRRKLNDAKSTTDC